MAENINLPSVIRDSDSKNEGSNGDKPAGCSHTRTVGIGLEADGSEVLELKKNISNLTKAFEALQNAYVERMDKIETDLKRNKDENESLKKQIQEKDKENSELQKLVQSLENKVLKTVKDFEEIKGLNCNQSAICFSARVNPAIPDVAPWGTIVFKDVETNAGNAYNSSTGEFTAPRGGYYVFYANILSQAGKCIETVIQVNGGTKLCIYSGGAPAYHGPGGNTVVVHLKTGDKVKVAKHGPWGTKPFYIHQVWSTFSGFLLKSD